MTCPQITVQILIKENSTRIVLTIYLGIYFQVQTQPINYFIEMTKYDWDTGIELPAGYFIHNATENYNNMVVEM